MKLNDLGDIYLVGGGGGLRGYLDVGSLKSIIKHGIHTKVKGVSGVSVSGLIFSAFLRARKAAHWEDVWEDVQKRFEIIARRGPEAVFYFSLRRIMTGAESAVDNGRLTDLLKDLDPKECVASPLYFEAPVTSRHYGRKIVLSNHTSLFRRKPELFPKLPEGTAALTPFFAPVRLRLNGEDDFLSDGISISMNRAVKRADTVIVLLPYPRKHVARPIEQYGLLSPMRIPMVRNFVDAYEIQHQEADRQVLGCAVSHAEICGHPRIITVHGDNCPATVGPLDFKKEDYSSACTGAEELMDRKLHSLGL